MSEPPPASSIIVERVAAGIKLELVDERGVRFDRNADPEIMKRVVSAVEEMDPDARSGGN